MGVRITKTEPRCFDYMYLSIHSDQHARSWCNKLTKKFVEQTSQAIAPHIGILSERIYSKAMHTAKAVPSFASLKRKTLRHDTLNEKNIPQHHEQTATTPWHHEQTTPTPWHPERTTPPPWHPE